MKICYDSKLTKRSRVQLNIGDQVLIWNSNILELYVLCKVVMILFMNSLPLSEIISRAPCLLYIENRPFAVFVLRLELLYT